MATTFLTTAATGDTTIALTSSSTDNDVWAAYENNADYDTSESDAKCILFIQALRFILLRRPSKSGNLFFLNLPVE